ncbi:hypothetical protein VE02_01926 [Pseudogymnoascus sp. 03VT05]|nr:hypothetical protein VE02_01926 [Pseudogymnoascus sp. 03VT05]
MAGRSRRSAALKAREAIAADSTSDIMSRARRDPDTQSSSHSRATLSRNDPPSSPSNPSLRLTVKMPVSKLRAATGGASSRTSAGRSSSGSGRGFAGETRESTRARGVKKSYVVESESEEEEDEEMEDLRDEEEEEDAEGEEEEDDMDLDEDAEGEEDVEGDDDTEMAGLPPPTLKISKPMKEKHSITVKTAGKKDVRVVATAEPSDDEELSELESEVEEDEETMQVGNDEDAEGEDEEIEVEVEEEEEEEEEEDELDSDEEGGGGSRGSTPDLSKLTKRQRARLDESGSGHLMALPDEVQVKKHLTAEEHAMRRAEMARRRKNLSEKRNEEEKMETINKLLKKQAPKTNARRRDLNGLTGEIGPDGEPGKPNSAYVRWISSKEGNRIGVPREMVEGPVGRLFGGGGGRVVEEVQ